MENKKRTVSILLITCMLVSISTISAFADEITARKFTADNGNMVVIDDSANLLTKTERSNLLKNMKAITEYGHVAFITIDHNDTSAEEYAKNRYRTLFGRESGTLFLIDMENRMIQFYSDGKVSRTISNTRSNEIADNTYIYATNEKYFECANKAFEQVLILLQGGSISTPMKHVTNALMAVCLGLLLNFLVVAIGRKKSVSIKQIDYGLVFNDDYLEVGTAFIKDVTSNMTSQKKRYIKSSSGSGGGGGGGGGSSGGHSF